MKYNVGRLSVIAIILAIALYLVLPNLIVESQATDDVLVTHNFSAYISPDGKHVTFVTYVTYQNNTPATYYRWAAGIIDTNTSPTTITIQPSPTSSAYGNPFQIINVTFQDIISPSRQIVMHVWVKNNASTSQTLTKIQALIHSVNFTQNYAVWGTDWQESHGEYRDYIMAPGEIKKFTFILNGTDLKWYAGTEGVYFHSEQNNIDTSKYSWYYLIFRASNATATGTSDAIFSTLFFYVPDSAYGKVVYKSTPYQRDPIAADNTGRAAITLPYYNYSSYVYFFAVKEYGYYPYIRYGDSYILSAPEIVNYVPSIPAYDNLLNALAWIYRDRNTTHVIIPETGGDSYGLLNMGYNTFTKSFYGGIYTETSGYTIPSLYTGYLITGNQTYVKMIIEIADGLVEHMYANGSAYHNVHYKVGLPTEQVLGLIYAYLYVGNKTYLEYAEKGANYNIMIKANYARDAQIQYMLYLLTKNETYKNKALASLNAVYQQLSKPYLYSSVEHGYNPDVLINMYLMTLNSTYLEWAEQYTTNILKALNSDGSLYETFNITNGYVDVIDDKKYIPAVANTAFNLLRLYLITENITYLKYAEFILHYLDTLLVKNFTDKIGLDAIGNCFGRIRANDVPYPEQYEWTAKWLVDAFALYYQIQQNQNIYIPTNPFYAKLTTGIWLTGVNGLLEKKPTFANQYLNVKIQAPNGVDSLTVIYTANYSKPYYVKRTDTNIMLTEVSSLSELEGTTNAWFYDSTSRLLYIKVRHYSAVPIVVSWETPPPPKEEQPPTTWEYYMITITLAIAIGALFYMATRTSRQTIEGFRDRQRKYVRRKEKRNTSV